MAAKSGGKAAAFGKGKGKPSKVKLTGAPGSYSGKTGIAQEVPTKKPTRGRFSKKG